MTPAELDEIKQWRKQIVMRPNSHFVLLAHAHIDKLLAEVERLTEITDNQTVAILDRLEHAAKLERENTRFREALEFYACKNNYYDAGYISNVEQDDYGKRARQALGMEEGEKDAT